MVIALIQGGFFMFISVSEDGALNLTGAGYALTVIILLGLVLLAGLAAKNYGKNGEERSPLSARQISFCGISIALATVLSMIKLYEFPFGGSITAFSMLFACLPGYFYGLGAGILSGAAYGVLQFLLGPYILFPAQVIVDYLLAFAALGLSGVFFRSKNGLIKGYLLAIVGRYVFAVISGWIFFGESAWEGWNPLPYSLAYNGAYIFAEGIVTAVILLIPAVKNGLASVKQMAVNAG